jgi:hypothetical protein
MQLHATVRVGVGRGEDLLADAHLDVQLLAKLAGETGVERFAGVALAARKLPVPLEVDTLLPPGHEKPSVAVDNRRGHHDAIHTKLSTTEVTEDIEKKSCTA